MKQSVALQLIIAEREAQDEKWGAHQSNSPAEWIAILGEEFGEVCTEVLRLTFGGQHTAQDAKEKLRAETVQLAAVAVAMLEELV